jgi:hypothetical protein
MYGILNGYSFTGHIYKNNDGKVKGKASGHLVKILHQDKMNILQNNKKANQHFAITCFTPPDLSKFFGLLLYKLTVCVKIFHN